jgi:hypothetical protein
MEIRESETEKAREKEREREILDVKCLLLMHQLN